MEPLDSRQKSPATQGHQDDTIVVDFVPYSVINDPSEDQSAGVSSEENSSAGALPTIELDSANIEDVQIVNIAPFTVESENEYNDDDDDDEYDGSNASLVEVDLEHIDRTQVSLESVEDTPGLSGFAVVDVEPAQETTGLLTGEARDYEISRLEVLRSNTPATYTMIEGQTREMLVDCLGYKYARHSVGKKGRIRWECAAKNTTFHCMAQIIQVGDQFTVGGRDHIHTPDKTKYWPRQEKQEVITGQVVKRAPTYQPVSLPELRKLVWDLTEQDVVSPDYEMRYYELPGTSFRGSDKLIDSEGFDYMRETRNPDANTVIWRCPKGKVCWVRVYQCKNVYRKYVQTGQCEKLYRQHRTHTHEPRPDVCAGLYKLFINRKSSTSNCTVQLDAEFTFPRFRLKGRSKVLSKPSNAREGNLPKKRLHRNNQNRRRAIQSSLMKGKFACVTRNCVGCGVEGVVDVPDVKHVNRREERYNRLVKSCSSKSLTVSISKADKLCADTAARFLRIKKLDSVTCSSGVQAKQATESRKGAQNNVKAHGLVDKDNSNRELSYHKIVHDGKEQLTDSLGFRYVVRRRKLCESGEAWVTWQCAADTVKCKATVHEIGGVYQMGRHKHVHKPDASVAASIQSNQVKINTTEPSAKQGTSTNALTAHDVTKSKSIVKSECVVYRSGKRKNVATLPGEEVRYFKLAGSKEHGFMIKLCDSDGYDYTRRGALGKNKCTVWQCRKLKKGERCKAEVYEEGKAYTRGEHVHIHAPGEQSEPVRRKKPSMQYLVVEPAPRDSTVITYTKVHVLSKTSDMMNVPYGLDQCNPVPDAQQDTHELMLRDSKGYMYVVDKYTGERNHLDLPST